MPSSDLAYKALHAALARKLERGDDVFVEASGPTSTTVYMFMVRTTPTQQAGVFANVDKRAATAPRVDNIPPADVTLFLAAVPPIALHASAGDEPVGGATYEVRVRNPHVDITLHFANPRRDDLVALARAIRELVTVQTS
jgi:hypothetical protein